MKPVIVFLFSGVMLLTSCITVNKYSRGYDDDLYYSRDERRSSYEQDRYSDDYDEEDRDDSGVIYDDTDTYTVYRDDCYSCLSWDVGIGFGWGSNYGWWTPYYTWAPGWTPYYAWSPGWWYYRPYYSAYYYDPYWGWDGWGRPGGYYNVQPRQYGPRSQRDNDLVNVPGRSFGDRSSAPGIGEKNRFTSRPRRTNTYTRSESSSGSDRIINNGNNSNTEVPAYRSRLRRSEPQPAVATPSERPTRRVRTQESGSGDPSPRRERIREGGTGTSAPRRERSYDSGSENSPSRSGGNGGGSRGSSGSDRPTRSPR